MARSSSAVLRAAAILDFIAEHPGQAFSMAELVRALKVSQSTCHSLLTALVKVGYLFRTTERMYVLGPGLASIGKLAAERYSPLQIAQPEMRRLADRFDVICSANFREGDTTVVRERATSARKIGYAADLGVPLKLRSSLAAIFLAWSPDEIEDWFSLLPAAQAAAERTTLELGIAFAREHGFLGFLKNPEGPPIETSPEKLFDGEISKLPIKLLPIIEADSSYDLSSIIAPVFNAVGKVEFTISLRGFADPIGGSEIFAIAEELKGACMRISSFSGGPRTPTWYSPV